MADRPRFAPMIALMAEIKAMKGELVEKALPENPSRA